MNHDVTLDNELFETADKLEKALAIIGELGDDYSFAEAPALSALTTDAKNTNDRSSGEYNACKWILEYKRFQIRFDIVFDYLHSAHEQLNRINQELDRNREAARIAKRGQHEPTGIQPGQRQISA